MTAAMMPEDRFSGIAFAKFGSFAEVVHGPDRAPCRSSKTAAGGNRRAKPGVLLCEVVDEHTPAGFDWSLGSTSPGVRGPTDHGRTAA
jgi:hypothetical protein